MVTYRRIRRIPTAHARLLIGKMDRKWAALLPFAGVTLDFVQKDKPRADYRSDHIGD